MTVMEFLDALPRHGWILRRSGAIGRRANAYTCPYAYVAYVHGISMVMDGLTGPGAVAWEEVFRAADNRPGHQRKIRRALLDACGLKARKTR